MEWFLGGRHERMLCQLWFECGIRANWHPPSARFFLPLSAKGEGFDGAGKAIPWMFAYALEHSLTTLSVLGDAFPLFPGVLEEAKQLQRRKRMASVRRATRASLRPEPKLAGYQVTSLR